jgi:hypothetical protein
VRVYSVDDERLRAAIGSGDRSILADWLGAVRAQAGRLPGDEVNGRERAAEQLVAGGIPASERDDGHHFGFAFLALCEAWADCQVVVECYVTEAFPALWVLAARASPNPFGVPQSPYGSGHVGWHEPSAVPSLRRALAAVRAGDPGLTRFGGTAENVAALEVVLIHAEASGRGVVVSWAA